MSLPRDPSPPRPAPVCRPAAWPHTWPHTRPTPVWQGLLPLSLVQLDDGWQSAWGDWLTPSSARFPNGLESVTAAAAAAGLTAGLWIAPAAMTQGSRLMAEHPEWVLRTPSGAPLKCGWTAPGLWIYALDVTHPGALGYIRSVIRTATRTWASPSNPNPNSNPNSEPSPNSNPNPNQVGLLLPQA